MFNFGTKKIVGANYTRYIALPKAWLSAFNMDVHSPVKVEMNEKKQLVLTPVLTGQDDAGVSQA